MVKAKSICEHREDMVGQPPLLVLPFITPRISVIQMVVVFFLDQFIVPERLITDPCGDFVRVSVGRSGG
jgi:hypothetical protein